MPFSPVTEADLAPLPQGFSTISESDLQPEVGALESVGRGALQGVTLGFSDEITGAIESLFSGPNGKTYQQSRDEARAANKAASEEHPYLYGGAELAAGLATPIPGLGVAKGAATVGAKLGAHALQAATAGGVAGLGASEADLTKPGGFQQAASDTIQSALLGGAIGLVGGKVGQMVGKSGAKAEDKAIKALAGGESKSSGAKWQSTRPMVNNPETRAILHEEVTFEASNGKTKTTTLEKVAGKDPDAIQQVVDAQTARISDEIRPIYAKADEKNGGVSLSNYLRRLDDEIKAVKEGRPATATAKEVKPMAPAEAKVYIGAIEELKDNALQQWGRRNPNLLQALESEQAKTSPAVRSAILKEFDVRIPSDEVRSEATALQKIGFKTVDPLNPGLHTQVKRDVGNMVRDFVNDHVMQTLGGEDHSRLVDLNKRMNAWLGVGTVAKLRAEKEAAGRMSLGGGLMHQLGHGSITAGVVGAMMGHPGALVAPVAVKAIEHAPAAVRTATRQVAKVDARLKAVAEAAKAGNPFAQSLVARIRQTPEGAARFAALQGGDQAAPEGTE